MRPRRAKKKEETPFATFAQRTEKEETQRRKEFYSFSMILVGFESIIKYEQRFISLLFQFKTQFNRMRRCFFSFPLCAVHLFRWLCGWQIWYFIRIRGYNLFVHEYFHLSIKCVLGSDPFDELNCHLWMSRFLMASNRQRALFGWNPNKKPTISINSIASLKYYYAPAHAKHLTTLPGTEPLVGVN